MPDNTIRINTQDELDNFLLNLDETSAKNVESIQIDNKIKGNPYDENNSSIINISKWPTNFAFPKLQNIYFNYCKGIKEGLKNIFITAPQLKSENVILSTKSRMFLQQEAHPGEADPDTYSKEKIKSEIAKIKQEANLDEKSHDQVLSDIRADSLFDNLSAPNDSQTEDSDSLDYRKEIKKHLTRSARYSLERDSVTHPIRKLEQISEEEIAEFAKKSQEERAHLTPEQKIEISAQKRKQREQQVLAYQEKQKALADQKNLASAKNKKEAHPGKKSHHQALSDIPEDNSVDFFLGNVGAPSDSDTEKNDNVHYHQETKRPLTPEKKEESPLSNKDQRALQILAYQQKQQKLKDQNKSNNSQRSFSMFKSSTVSDTQQDLEIKTTTQQKLPINKILENVQNSINKSDLNKDKKYCYKAIVSPKEKDKVLLTCNTQKVLTASSDTVRAHRSWNKVHPAAANKNELKAKMILDFLGIPPIPEKGIHISKEESALGKAVRAAYNQIVIDEKKKNSDDNDNKPMTVMVNW